MTSIQNTNIYDINVYTLLRNQFESHRYVLGMTIEQADEILYVLHIRRSALHLLNVGSFGKRTPSLNQNNTTNYSSDSSDEYYYSSFVGKLDS